jgi:ParB family transcriptional regulator, chromosome partitioning protein
MTTSNATAVDKAATAGSEKVPEKLAEKRRALGRGLESLLPGPRVVQGSPTLPQNTRKDGAPLGAVSLPTSDSPATLEALQASGQTENGESVFSLDIELIDQNPYQTRREFDLEALKELARSIDTQGVLQPVVVRPGTEEGRFVLVLGERRLRASKLAGKQTIPVIVKRVSEQQAAEMTLVENLQRRDLNCVEQAEAFSNLSKDFKMTQEEIGRRAGVSREQVANYMRLLLLPEGVIGALQTGKLTYTHARTLLHLRDNAEIWKFAQRAIAEKMSVAQLEDLVLGVTAPPGAKTGGAARWVDPNVKAAQRSLEEALGMRVRIRDRKGRGRIVIEYGTLEDFDRVVGMLKGK